MQASRLHIFIPFKLVLTDVRLNVQFFLHSLDIGVCIILFSVNLIYGLLA